MPSWSSPRPATMPFPKPQYPRVNATAVEISPSLGGNFAQISLVYTRKNTDEVGIIKYSHKLV